MADIKRAMQELGKTLKDLKKPEGTPISIKNAEEWNKPGGGYEKWKAGDAARDEGHVMGAPMQVKQPVEKPAVPSYKSGIDMVPKTGPAVLHEGEAVLNADDAEDYRKEKMADKPKNVSLYRAMRHLNKGGLHRALKIPENQPIPRERLEQARNSDNPHIAKMAQFAHTMAGFDHS